MAVTYTRPEHEDTDDVHVALDDDMDDGIPMDHVIGNSYLDVPLGATDKKTPSIVASSNSSQFSGPSAHEPTQTITGCLSQKE